jgi:hypothetical protein
MLLPVLLVLLVLVAIVLRPRRATKSRAWSLLRCLVPAWRFFEQLEPMPQLRYRIAEREHEFGEWRDALPAPRRTAASLFLNADGNLHLACQSLVEHLEADLDGDEPLGSAVAQELVSYRLLQASIERRVRQADEHVGRRYQFCLAWSDEEAVFVSAIHVA